MTTVNVNARQLREALKRVSYAQSTEETRYYLCGVCLECAGGDLVAVATDGYRLASAAVNTLEPALAFDNVIVPRRGVSALIDALPSKDNAVTARVDISELSLDVSIDDGPIKSLNIRRLDGQYPDWRRVLPRADNLPHALTLPLKLLHSAARGDGVAADKWAKNRATLRFEFDSDSVRVVFVANPGGEDRLEHECAKLTYAGDARGTVVMSARYVRDVCALVPHTKYATITMRFQDPLSSWAPFMFDLGLNEHHVLMPMRV